MTQTLREQFAPNDGPRLGEPSTVVCAGREYAIYDLNLTIHVAALIGEITGAERRLRRGADPAQVADELVRALDRLPSKGTRFGQGRTWGPMDWLKQRVNLSWPGFYLGIWWGDLPPWRSVTPSDTAQISTESKL